MKKWTSWLLVAVMLFGFTACNGAPDVSDDGSDTTTTPTLSLAEAYTDALTRYQNDASIHRNIGELQPETQEIIRWTGNSINRMLHLTLIFAMCGCAKMSFRSREGKLPGIGLLSELPRNIR